MKASEIFVPDCNICYSFITHIRMSSGVCVDVMEGRGGGEGTPATVIHLVSIYIEEGHPAKNNSIELVFNYRENWGVGLWYPSKSKVKELTPCIPKPVHTTGCQPDAVAVD